MQEKENNVSFVIGKNPMFDDINNILSKSIQKEYNALDKKDEFYRYITDVMSYPYYRVDISLEKFILVSKTPKGFWIKRKWDTEAFFKKWVSATSRKRYAYPTKKQALIAYLKRTGRYISILQNKLSTAETGYTIANQLEKLNE